MESLPVGIKRSAVIGSDVYAVMFRGLIQNNDDWCATPTVHEINYFS